MTTKRDGGGGDDDGGGGGYKVKGLLIAGGLVHPHIHLDKCYLLDQTPVQDGTFKEAVSRTDEAKRGFREGDLVDRGERLIRTSIQNGVLAMRAHVEIDPTVGHQCLSAGQILKRRYKKYCDVQLAAFAQDPLLYPDDPHKQEKMLELMVGACQSSDVTAIGSAPYVENAFKNETDNYRAQCQNVRIIFELASKFDKDIDFHLDYNLDPKCEPLLWFVLEEAHRHDWKRLLTIGHATRLSLFKQEEWARLQRLKEGLRVAFVGLPPSDIYMQGRETPYSQRTRATLPLLQLAMRGFPTALGVNNVCNLFTPQGDGDPMAMLPLVVGLWQTAKKEDLESILNMVGSTARETIGLSSEQFDIQPILVELSVAQDGTVESDQLPAGLSTFTLLTDCESVRDAVLAPSAARIAVKDGRVVAWTKVEKGLTTL